MHVLIIEDHVDTAEFLAKLVLTLGHSCKVVHTRADAVAELALPAGTHFDVAFVDLMLPDGDGAALVPLLAEAGTKPVALSGRDADAAGKKTAGFVVHLTKPVNVADLTAVLMPHGSGGG